MCDVALEKCGGYSFEEVYAAVKNAVERVSGLDWVRPGMTVVIKANLVSAMKPDRAATTHPMAICAMTKILRDMGADVVIGDSPGGLYSQTYVNHIYNVTGMTAAREYGGELNQDFSQRQADFPEGKVLHSFLYTGYLDRADGIVNLCKLKSHGMMGMSAGAKNMFGAIPGTVKPEYHFKFPDYSDFADMIVDINEYFKPRLTVTDAVVGMEGNGPTAGDAREMGFIAASKSPHAADLVCSEILGLKKENLPILLAAQRRELIPESAEELCVHGGIEDFKVTDFKYVAVPTSLVFSGKNPFMKLLSRVAGGVLRTKPRLEGRECVGCGVCKKVCPAGAVEIKGGRAVIDRKRCIRCFCCQEFCPKGAMKVHRSFLARVMGKM